MEENSKLFKGMAFSLAFLSFAVLGACGSSADPSLLSKAEKEYMKGNYKQVVSLLSGRRLDPRASVVLAKSYFFLGETEKAGGVLEKVLRKHPYHFEANLWLSRIRMLEKNYVEAEKYVSRALSSDPTNLQANLLYSRLLLKKGLLEEAIYRLEIARTNEITLYQIYRELDRLYAVIGDNKTRKETSRGVSLLKRLVSSNYGGVGESR